LDTIEKAKESIKNIPILAFIKQSDGSDEADFGGHESEVVLSSDGIKYRYLGRPIGIIPADGCDYHYEMYDGKTYVAVTGYIWTDYANEALDILEKSGEKGQSMEIRVDDGDWDINDCFNITSYRYTGVTILGDNVTPAMTGAKVQLFSADNKTFSDEYFTMVDELNLALKSYASQPEESEVSDMEDEKELEKDFEAEGAEGAESTEVPVGEVADETNSVEGETPSADEVPVEEEFEEETPAEVPSEETPVEEQVDYSAQITTLNTELFNLRQSYETLEAEVIVLREYKRVSEEAKAKAEKEAEFAKKEAIFTELSCGLTDDEMQPVKDKINELSVKEITDQLNAIFTAKNLAVLKAKKFSNDAPKGGVVIDVPKKENTKSRYAV
jgi:hypothetical protein